LRADGVTRALARTPKRADSDFEVEPTEFPRMLGKQVATIERSAGPLGTGGWEGGSLCEFRCRESFSRRIRSRSRSRLLTTRFRSFAIRDDAEETSRSDEAISRARARPPLSTMCFPYAAILNSLAVRYSGAMRPERVLARVRDGHAHAHARAHAGERSGTLWRIR